VIHLYAFVHGLRELDAGLQARPFGSVVAVVGREEPDPLRHGLVVETLLDRADAVLPVRFGERFETGRSVVVASTALLPHLLERLERVRGCVELGVRIGFSHERNAEPRAGSDYIRGRAAHAAHVAAAVARLEVELRALSEETVVPRLAVQEDAYRAAFLVRREATPAFVSTVSGFAEAHRDAAVLCTGPWPPYSFAEAA
jgi:hypothetical protein